MTVLDDPGRLAAVAQLELFGQPPEERFRRITDAAQRLLGVPMTYLNLVGADSLWVTACIGASDTEIDREVSFCQHVVAGGAVVLVDDALADARFRHNPLVLADGGIRAYLGSPLRGPDGHLVGTLCAVDVQPRRWSDGDVQTLQELSAWAELELAHGEVQRRLAAGAQAQRLTESVLSSAGEGICAIDCDGRITMANPAAARLTGWSVEELLGQPIHDRLHGLREDGSSYPEADCPLLRTLGTGEGRNNVDEIYWRRDGSRLPVQLSVAPILEDGEVAGVVVVFEDVTAREEVERLKDEFVSVVSHELRTPLTSMRGSLGLLSAGVAGDLPAEAGSLVDMALSNTDRLVRLVGEILDLERLSTGRVQLVRHEVPLRDLVEAAARAVVGLADAAGVRLEHRAEDAAGWFDSDRVVQVLVNLLGNAVKFTAPGGTVTVMASYDGDDVVLAVTDPGRGIPPELLGRVFDRLAQVEVGDARTKGGSGLGLAIARSIAEAHGGTLVVTSEIGVGSTFTVRLPQGQGG